MSSIASLPPEVPQQGGSIHRWATSLVNWLKRNRPVAGAGLVGQQTSGGYVISASNGYANHPFKIRTSKGDGEDGEINVFPGKVFHNIADDYGAPPNTFVGNTGATSLPVPNGTNYVEIEVSLGSANFGTASNVSHWQLGTASIVVSNGAKGSNVGDISEGDTTGTMYITIGTVVKYSDVITEIIQAVSDDVYFVWDQYTAGTGVGGLIPDGDNSGDMLVWYKPGSEWDIFNVGSEGQTLDLSSLGTNQEWRYRPFSAHIEGGVSSTIKVEGGYVIGPYSGDEVSTVSSSTFSALSTNNYFYVEVHAIRRPTGWEVLPDGIPGYESFYPILTRYDTEQVDFVPVGGQAGAKVFRFPVAYATASGGSATAITQVAFDNIYFNRDSAATIGYTIYKAGGSTIVKTIDEVLSGFAAGTNSDWSIEYTVSSGAITTEASPFGVTDTALYEMSGTTQIAARIPIVRDDLVVSSGGSWRENIYCSGTSGPIVELLKIG